MSAPMRSSTRAKPMRVQLVPMFVTRISAPGTIAAAASQNAADDGSPGTCRCPPTSSSTGTTVTRRPLRWTAAPSRVSIRSVWSRLACGSVTVVGPSARSPAMSTHDFTCALATGMS